MCGRRKKVRSLEKEINDETGERNESVGPLGELRRMDECERWVKVWKDGVRVMRKSCDVCE